MEVTRRVQPILKEMKKWTLEPALFLLFFGWILSNAVMTNQMLKQTCLYTFGYDEDTCMNLDDKNRTNNVESEIQPYVASILTTTTVFSSIITTVISLSLGPWSDTNGRKRVINLIFLGFATTLGWMTIVSNSSDHIATNSPWNYFFAQIPMMLSGGIPMVITIVLCYVHDQTTQENRSKRLTIFEIIIFIGVFIGTVSRGHILNATSPSAVFAISFCCTLIGTLIAVFFVDETVKVQGDVKYSEIFSLSRTKKMCMTCIKPRSFRRRQTLWMILVILIIGSLIRQGEATIFYLFVRHKFQWDLVKYTLYESATRLVSIIGSIVGLGVLKKRFGFDDLSLSMLSLVSIMIDAFIKTIAEKSWHLFMGSFVTLFHLLSGPMLRSVISVVVSKSEVSGIYSIASATEALTGILAAPLYSATYSVTLATFPSAFNLITVGVSLLAISLAYLIQKRLIPLEPESDDKNNFGLNRS